MILPVCHHGRPRRLFMLSVLLLAAGCFQHPHPVAEGMPCAKSGICPAGYTCDRSKNRCVLGDGLGDASADSAYDSGAVETQTLDGRWDTSGRTDGADAREAGLPGPDGPDASSADGPRAATLDSAEPDVPVGATDAGGNDVPVATGGSGGRSGASSDAGGVTATGGSVQGGAGGVGGVGGGGPGGSVSNSGGALVDAGLGSGGSVNTGGAGGVLVGGTSAVAGTTASPDAALAGTTSLPDAAAGGTVSTGGSGGAGGMGGTTVSPPNLVASPASLDFGDVVRGEQSLERTFTLTNQGGDSGPLGLVVSGVFALVGGPSNSCGPGGITQLVHNASCIVTVVFNPPAAAGLGNASGKIELFLDEVSVGQVQLTGRAVCPKYQQDDGTGVCVQGDYPMGNDPIPSSGCGTDGVLDLRAGAAVNGGYRLNITSSDEMREYIVDIPSGYDPNTPVRLFFCLHIMGGTAEQVQDGQCFSLKPLATSAGIPAVYVAPQSDGQYWQDKDNALFADLLAHMKAKLCIDTSRVFVTGFSLGGIMTYVLTVSHPRDIRAAVGIAPTNWGLPIPDPKPHLPVAWMQTSGMVDATCRWDLGGERGAKYLAIEKGTDNGCTVPSPIPTVSSGDPHRCESFTGCKASYPTKICTFNGAHTDSNIDPGTTTNWIPQESWDFFAQF